MKIYFHSGDLACKTPFGAVKTEETVQFKIYVYNDVYVERIFLVTGEGAQYPFSYAGCENNYSKYRLEVSFSEPGVQYYCFLLETEHGVFYGKNRDGVLEIDESLPWWQLTVYDRNFTVPEWAKGKIMYQIFPDRFAKSADASYPPVKNQRKLHDDWNAIPDFIYQEKPYLANDYLGGNLRGITENLDYLKKLGVEILYLNPIFESGENHRYSTADYKKIDPYLGDDADFDALIAACNKRKIRVILDGVFSHTGADSRYFNKYGHYDSVGAYQSEQSPYYPWYSFQKHPDSYECWWGFRNLPNVREDNEVYLDYITNPEHGVLKYWQDRGVAGWRLDVADELPDVFIDRLRQCVKTVNPDALIIGEVWEDASNKESYGVKRRYLLGKQLDSVMNYPFRTAIIEYVKTNHCGDFVRSVMQILENYPEEVLLVLMNSLGTHDTRRILTEFGVEREIAPEQQGVYRMSEKEYSRGKECLKLAVVLQFTLPGIPSIYYGDEVGLQGFADPYCRMGYPWGKEDTDILGFYHKITAFHKKYHKDLLSRMTSVSEMDGLIYYQRGNLEVYVNAGDEAVFYKDCVKGTLVFSDKAIAHNEYGMIMSPKSFAIFKGDSNK